MILEDISFKYPKTPGYISLEDDPSIGVHFQSWPNEIVYGVKASFESAGRGDANNYKPNEINYINKGSSLEIINFSLTFKAGDEENESIKSLIPTIQSVQQASGLTSFGVTQVNQKVALLQSMAMPRSPKGRVRRGKNPYGSGDEGVQVPKVIITLGGWVSWPGYLENVQVTAKGPWEVVDFQGEVNRTARPMSFDVNLSFLPCPDIYLSYEYLGPEWFNLIAIGSK